MLEITRSVPLAKGSFILYDKMSKTIFPNCIWNFLFNPEVLTNEVEANVSSMSYSGANWPIHHTNGIKEERYKMTLALTGDSLENKSTLPENTPFVETIVGGTSIRVTPLYSSQVGTNPSVDAPSLFTDFGKFNMTYRIEFLKSLMLRDPDYEWRILFNYGNIVPGGKTGFPNTFILSSLSASHHVVSADLNTCILAMVDVELLVDASTPTTRLQYLNLFREQQNLYSGGA